MPGRPSDGVGGDEWSSAEESAIAEEDGGVRIARKVYTSA